MVLFLMADGREVLKDRLFMSEKGETAMKGKNRKKVFDRVVTALVLAVSMLIGIMASGIGEATASAATGKPKLIRWESMGANQIAFEADLTNVTGYGTWVVYRSLSAKTGFKKLDTVQGNSWTSNSYNMWYTFGDKDRVVCFSQTSDIGNDVVFMDRVAVLGRKYYYKIALVGIDGKAIATSNVIACRTKLPKPELTKCTSTDGRTVKLSWNKSDKAQGYIIFKNDGKGWKRFKKITKGSVTKYTDKNVKTGRNYRYRVRAYSKSGSKVIYSEYSTAMTATLKNPTVKGQYSVGSVYGPYLNAQELVQVRRAVQNFKINYIKSGMTEYEKALAAFNYIRNNCSYARRGWQYNNANTAWGALVYGEAQCSGFARGYKALCDAIGVKCYYVHANGKAINPSHQWNMVKMGSKWYVTDAQGGFFLVGSYTWKGMGMAWDTAGLPTCSKKDHSKGGFAGSIN